MITAPHSKSPSTFLDALPSGCSVLRNYQREQLAAIAEAICEGSTRICVQLSTGGGKTHEIAGITLAAVGEGLRVLILATRTRLVRQLHERLEAFGVTHGVIAAELPGMLDNFQQVQVASVDTLYRRAVVNERTPLPPAEVVVFDEAHLAAADSRLKLLEQYPQALRIGFTATPARKSGRSLSAVFDELILGPTSTELIASGILVRPRIFSAPVLSTAELDALPKDTGNDYAAGAAAELMQRAKLVGNVVSNWLRIAAGRRTLLFACNKAHGQQLTEEFLQAGVATELLTDVDDDITREAAIRRLERDQTRIIVNCFLMSYGVDLPSVECIVLARPTRSVVMYLQMVGRGLRAAPDKADCMVIDHGRVVETLGFPTSNFSWSLDERRNVNAAALAAAARRSGTETAITCPECGCMWLVSERGSICESCGWAPAPTPKAVRTTDVDLVEIGSSSAAAAGSSEITAFFRETLTFYGNRWPQRWRENSKKGRWWGWMKTLERFGISSDARMPCLFWEIEPAPLSEKVRGWLYSRHIRYLKAGAWVSA